ncbi:hypothetical protein AVEN_201268-1 [Araneus ventricosus]|uniref:Reverse transcriptase domain-containing protein n=1 Tax=Araneus ventricosus TaxID=182803 RepID=A0A4Y2L7U3_ARAVE|nr:hypothetical protein AVEN_232854-1 [Araneus ventricosus]GBN10490.1 hypothetical protein AVEN_37629-1 [Araneus ventricosus]GBN10516.1 hypothetical protein AVEN_149738-1 [Araneus ventricosus]GBN10546.1 hypothetical protein AVEN_201268-1 [Araneus ventricosus]
MFPIGLSADIEKAFLQIGIAPHDRDYLRFFYPRDEGEIYRHCRVVFGVTSSPFILSACIEYLLDHAPHEFSGVVQKLRQSFYVDNCLTGVKDVSEEKYFIEMAQKVMSTACFNLRGWESNFPCKYVSKSSGVTGVLGMLWDLDKDALKCNINLKALTCENRVTKRLILSLVQQIFDPIGILTPATLFPKLLLQEMWKKGISWDEILPGYFLEEFYKWLAEMPLLSNVEIPRYMIILETSEFHVFVDASRGAYAACIFVRSVDSNGVNINLVRAKSRVAPLKTISIPRLELLACCIGARLANSVRNALDLPDMKITFWTDSSVVLWWIREQGEWSVFVTNRVREIKTLSQQQSWRHVPGNVNPADVLSRGCSPKQMLKYEWWNGPEWLLKHPDFWPSSNICYDTNDIEAERREIKLSNVNLSEESTPWFATKFSRV